ncbi:hypothetical protein F4779DRAFT_634931 [Xylariaceae sp. FL0662B]|nr:hypothetical protein F4779DRAFT_634931 [Xylariaceae sp. FL0662B]
MGEQCDEDLDFCPYKLIRSFPFMETLLENTWDFLYLLDPGPRSRDPLLLVPSIQFEQYLNYASVQLNMKLSIPRGGTREKFFVRFGDDDTPLPRYLGRPDSTGALEYLKLQISKLPKDNLTRLTRSVLHNYMEKMDDVYGSFLSAKSKKDLEAAKIKRIERQKRYGRMVKRVQRYLGLRGQRAYPSTLRIPLTGWNVDMEVPFRTQGSVRFVCVDIEAWERHPNVITEVGLAILDTDDTMNVPPGRDGHNWFQLIESYHFRISEHSDKVNHRFVKGCPTLFNFGTTEFVSLRNINRVIGKIIGDHESEDRRPVILVGHDIGQDLKYLQKLDYNVWRVQQILDEVDTKSMFQRFEQSSNGRGLANVCSDLGIPGQNFHNAGNDATYTLRAMIATAVKHMVEGPREGTENNTSRPR